MNILALDTCFGAVSVAVRWRSGRGEWLLREAYEALAAGHAERIVALIGETMAAAGLDYAQIDRIAVTLGPGGFTGLRAGIAAARALALALHKPVVGLSSLAVMSERANLLLGNARGGRPIVVAVDARRQSFFSQSFASGALDALDEPMLLDAAGTIARWPTGPVLVVGSGAAESRRCIGTRRRRSAVARSPATCAPTGYSGPYAGPARSGKSIVPARRRRQATGAVCHHVSHSLLTETLSRPRREDPLMSADALNPMHVSLLWATVEHADDLASCHATLFPEPWTAAAFQQFLSDPGSVALVARYGSPQQTVGFIVGQLAADEAEILTFGVARQWQRRGIGRRLIEGLQRGAARGGATRLHLEVAEDNLPALVLYSRLGFKDIGRRKDYYKRADGPAVDALKLSLELTPA